jgi:hypothetical protein
LVRVRLDVQGNEDQALANFLRPLVGEDERAALAVDLGDAGAAIFVVALGAGETELVDVEAERGFYVFNVEDGAGEPVCH